MVKYTFCVRGDVDLSDLKVLEGSTENKTEHANLPNPFSYIYKNIKTRVEIFHKRVQVLEWSISDPSNSRSIEAEVVGTSLNMTLPGGELKVTWYSSLPSL